MKKTLAIIALAIILTTAAFAAGKQAGVNYAIENSEIWMAGGMRPYDGSRDIYLELDGQIYVHSIWVY